MYSMRCEKLDAAVYMAAMRKYWPVTTTSSPSASTQGASFHWGATSASTQNSTQLKSSAMWYSREWFSRKAAMHIASSFE